MSAFWLLFSQSPLTLFNEFEKDKKILQMKAYHLSSHERSLFSSMIISIGYQRTKLEPVSRNRSLRDSEAVGHRPPEGNNRHTELISHASFGADAQRMHCSFRAGTAARVGIKSHCWTFFNCHVTLNFDGWFRFDFIWKGDEYQWENQWVPYNTSREGAV